MPFSVFQNKPTEIVPITTTSSAIVADYISTKLVAGMVYLVINLKQAAAHATVLTPKRATAVAGTNVTGLATAAVCRIWANEDTAASDTLVAQTAAIAYTVTADIKNKVVIFEIDPNTLGEYSAGVPYDVIGLGISASSEATNFACANAYISDLRYGGTTPPSIIVD